MEISWHILLNILTLAIKIQMETLETKLRKQNLLDLRWGSMIISKFIDYRWCMRILERDQFELWNTSLYRYGQGKTMVCKLLTFPRTTALTYLEDIHLRQYEIKETWLLIQIIAMTEYNYFLDDFTKIHQLYSSHNHVLIL